MSEDIRRKMRELEKQVEHHMHLYYDLDAPELEDYEYDRLIHSLMDLEEQYPQYASPNSPTKRVGGKAQNTFREVTHKVQNLYILFLFHLNIFLFLLLICTLHGRFLLLSYFFPPLDYSCFTIA